MAEQTLEPKRSKISTLRLFVGIYLISAMPALSHIWGNINVYALSYFHFRVKVKVESESSWTLAVFSMIWGFGMLAASSFSRWFGFRKTLIASIIIYSVSMSLCYFAVQRSFVILNILLGVMCGFTFGIFQALEINLITLWATPKSLGMALSGVAAVQEMSIMVLSLILTSFVNPKNIHPDKMGVNSRLFSQSEILDKVPYMFIVYGVIVLGTGILASVLVWDSTPKRSKQRNDSKCEDSSSERLYNKEGSSICETYMATSHTVHCDKDTHFQHRLKNDTQDRRNEVYVFKVRAAPTPSFQNISQELTTGTRKEQKASHEFKASVKVCSDQGADVVANTATIPSATNNREVDKELQSNNSSLSVYTLKNVLKGKTFYVLVMMGAYPDIVYTILNTYYKTFGFIFYPDDHFFTAMGLWMNIGAAVGMFLSGMVSDKFSPKNAVVAFTAISCLLSVFFYVSAHINIWFYFVLGVLYNGFTVSIFNLMTVCATTYYGKELTTTVQGMALLSLCITNTAMPLAASFILSSFGWLQLFTSVSIFILATLLIFVVGLGPVPTID